MTINKIAVFISGRGSNMEALIQEAQKKDFPSQIKLVLSDQKDAKGLLFAKSQGIETAIIERKNFHNKKNFEQEILTLMTEKQIDFICLAGFMRLLSASFCEKWTGRMINIHPSLLPAFKGLDTHERALDMGVAFSGCTVHYVSADMDSGDIIAQASLKINPKDTSDLLGDKVLSLEHILYPKVLHYLCLGLDTKDISFFKSDDG